MFVIKEVAIYIKSYLFKILPFIILIGIIKQNLEFKAVKSNIEFRIW